ncbi:MAG: DUF1295 domain-containing protein [Promethearchaeota archaeon]|jgi:steroid 5-alpha reductase family enzyme
MNESDLTSGKRVKGFIYIIIIYIIAIIISLIVGTLLNSLHPILIILLADISATLFIFVISNIFKNSSFYDPYWSVAPAVISIYLIFNSISSNINFLHQIIILSLVLIWSIRLTYNWARLWQGLDDEDWRYTKLRVEKGKSFWLANLIGIHLMPTIVVFLGCLSLYPIFSINRSSFGYIDVIVLSITLFAIIIETVSDQQLYQFIKNRENSAEFIKKGLWKYSRHPNYFGEILFWWGLYLFALITELSFWWMIIGPLSITILFYVLSIPMMEERNLSRKPTYLEYKESVSKLIPWFPKKRQNS